MNINKCEKCDEVTSITHGNPQEYVGALEGRIDVATLSGCKYYMEIEILMQRVKRDISPL